MNQFRYAIYGYIVEAYRFQLYMQLIYQHFLFYESLNNSLIHLF